MKKRNKKYNPNKYTAAHSKIITRGKAIMFIGGSDKGCFVVDLKTGQDLRVNADLARAFGEVPHQWSMLQAIFCRRQDGQEYAKFQQIQTSAKYYERDLEHVFNESHSSLHAECNKEHVLTAGWIVVNNEHDWSEKKAGEIFRKHGAWDFLTDREAQSMESAA